ncbi:sensor histidine kinase [Marinomonas epiphytica]
MQQLDISTILASAIHESKNQVGTLLYKLQTLKEDLSAETQHHDKVIVIEESLKKLNDEWVEYLYLYKLASEGYELHLDQFLMEEFLDDQVFALASSAQAHKLELDFQCPDQLLGTFDERLLTAVVSTAVYNAMRFAQQKILIRAELQTPYLVISIEDDGEGFKADELSEELNNSNTGLGLYFSELSAKAHSKKGVEGYIAKEKSDMLGGAKLAIYLPQ